MIGATYTIRNSFQKCNILLFIVKINLLINVTGYTYVRTDSLYFPLAINYKSKFGGCKRRLKNSFCEIKASIVFLPDESRFANFFRFNNVLPIIANKMQDKRIYKKF